MSTGEVALGKRVEERKETVRDTVRRSEVEVEKIGTTLASRSKLRKSLWALPANVGRAFACQSSNIRSAIEISGRPYCNAVDVMQCDIMMR